MLLTGEYTWTESDGALQLCVPLKGSSPASVDVFATDCILKVSYPPYLIDLNLKGCIDDAGSTAKVKGGTLVVTAPKAAEHCGAWGELVLGRDVPKGEIKERRERSIQAKRERDAALAERAKTRKHEDERKALRAQMASESGERQQLEDRKADEKARAEAEVFDALEALARERAAAATATAATAAPAQRKPAAASSKATAAAPQRKRVTFADEQPQEHHLQQQQQQQRAARGAVATVASAAAAAAASPVEGAAVTGSQHQQSVTFEVGNDDKQQQRPQQHRLQQQQHLRQQPVVYDADADDCSSAADGESDGADGGGSSAGGSNSGSSSGSAAESREEASHADRSSSSSSSSSALQHNAERGIAQHARTPSGEQLGEAAQRQECVDEDDDVRYIPAPRHGATVSIGFTPRLFPTPARESKAKEEGAWIMKNRRHLSKNAALRGRLPADGTALEDSDPTWLKGRGDDLYRRGDWRSAVNAYTAALDADDRFTAALSNRAACHLHLGQLDACIRDCSAALDLLKDQGGAQSQMLKLLARRGAALSQQGHHRSGLEDLRAALAFDISNAPLMADIARVDRLAQSLDAKRDGDALLAARNVPGARAAYTRALALDPASVPCLSNRAACHLAAAAAAAAAATAAVAAAPVST